ncbi:hypothetical protein E2562_011936 [Oryza meyeriana var. granulata]|uniref:Uncharacterized protein n=1 Tax=Oryza meyeriana var. granulata TaxID=110450 RepID=A0A6G1CFQ8_9ORYZ|nr:hypothetical protein E2562_011936 [Oryza meyeriana var. granulata]
MSSPPRDTPRSPDFRHDGGASTDHSNSAVVVVPSEQTPMESETSAGSPDAPMDQHGGHDDAPPVVHRGGGGPAGSTTPAPPQPRLDPPTLARALRRCSIKLGKQKVLEEASTATAATAPEPPPKKLMHDGIRAAAATPILASKKIITYVVAAAATERKKTTANGSNADSRFSNLHSSSVELRRRLEELDATEPEFVCEKMLQKSDVHLNQNRLLISCKRDLAMCPITYLFTDKETRIVHNNIKKAVENGVVENGPVEDDEVVKVGNKDKIVQNEKEKKKKEEEEEKLGLKVTMFDEGGNEYGTMCRYLTSNGGYRFIDEWGKFLKSNGMAISKRQNWTRNVLVKLWAFRSRKLPGAEQSDHPDGGLGFVVLHYENKSSGSNSNKESVKAMSSFSAASVVPKSEVSAVARVTRRSTEEDDEVYLGAVQGIVKLQQGQCQLLSSSEYKCSSESSSDEEKKTED